MDIIHQKKNKKLMKDEMKFPVIYGKKYKFHQKAHYPSKSHKAIPYIPSMLSHGQSGISELPWL